MPEVGGSDHVQLGAVLLRKRDLKSIRKWWSFIIAFSFLLKWPIAISVNALKLG